MTVQEAISGARQLRSTTFSDAQMLEWLNQAEGFVMTEVLLWPVRKVYRYVYDRTVTVGMYFPDDRHLALEADEEFPAGGTLTISGLTAYAPNNKSNLDVIAMSDDRAVYTFQPGTFTEIGEDPETGTLTYDGRGCQLLALPPFDKLYIPYLLAQMAFAQEEWDAYTNHMAMYNEYLAEFSRWFARNYRPADWGYRV